MNLPNRLTSYRILLTVIFILLLSVQGALSKALALVTFILAVFTDYWDGKFARERGQVSRFGQLMDPIADKILTLSAFLAFVQMGIMPAWMVVLIITRDLLITSWRLLPPSLGDSQSSRGSGKQKTVLQFAAIVGVLLFLAVKETSVWKPEWTPSATRLIYFSLFFIVVVTLWSGIRYAIKNLEMLE